MDQIITSILDNDLYKFTMQQAVFYQYPLTDVEYQFNCRTKDVNLSFLAPSVRKQIDFMAGLTLLEVERRYLKSIRFLKPDYIDFLSKFRFNPATVEVNAIDGQLTIRIFGKWYETILWEVPILAIVSELYFKKKVKNIVPVITEGRNRLADKIEQINFYRLPLVDMGTRRRFSKKWQAEVVSALKTNCSSFIGTSNVYLAMINSVKVIGTQAHEWQMAHLGIVDNVAQAQKRAFHVWLQEYGTDLGIALADTFSSKAFFQDFDSVLANGFSGVRHDSGDPIKFGYQTIDHYQKLNINPKLKTIVFSDSLDIPKAINIYLEFVSKIGVSFGIGTNLTNDLGPKALNIVIKLSKSNGKPVVKISDSPGKILGDLKLAEELKKIYNLD